MKMKVGGDDFCFLQKKSLVNPCLKIIDLTRLSFALKNVSKKVCSISFHRLLTVCLVYNFFMIFLVPFNGAV